MARIFFSAAHKSSGKTTVSTGITAALRGAGVDVRPFKKGPDFIDPMWQALAAGRPCYNLDFHTQELDEIKSFFDLRSAGGDIAVIEGNKGLHDGMDVEGLDSNAHLAKTLSAPVVLVVDSRGMTRGVAPMLLGIQQFDPGITIGGVILNFVGGPRHESKLRAVIERYTDIPVIGAVHKNAELALSERHIGLIPTGEVEDSAAYIKTLARIIGGEVDLGAVRAIAATAPALAPATAAPALPAPDITIAIARSPAFGFYYPDDLEAMERAGAKLVFFSPEEDHALPAADGLFIGGGFPETRMDALGANREMLQSIGAAINAGLPAYAECGGMMYLSRSISWNGQKREMAGVIPADSTMRSTPQGRGYIVLEPQPTLPWGGDFAKCSSIPAHEFHYSRMENMAGDGVLSYKTVRGQCIDGFDGMVINNLLAGYAHLRNTSRAPWVKAFTDFVRAHKNKK